MRVSPWTSIICPRGKALKPGSRRGFEQPRKRGQYFPRSVAIMKDIGCGKERPTLPFGSGAFIPKAYISPTPILLPKCGDWQDPRFCRPWGPYEQHREACSHVARLFFLTNEAAAQGRSSCKAGAMFTSAALVRRAVQARPKGCCRATGLAVRLLGLVLFSVLIFTSLAAQSLASKYGRSVVADIQDIIKAQARAAGEEEMAVKDEAKAVEDEAGAERDEAEEEADEAEVEADEAKEAEAEGKAEADAAKARAEEAEADEERGEAAADEAAADAEQAEAGAESAKAAEEEVDAEADEAAEAVLSFVPFVDVVADTVGTALAGGLQAASMADGAEAATLEAQSLSERAAETQAEVASAAARAAEREARNDENQEGAAAAEAEEAAEEAEADAARKKADEVHKEEDASLEEAKAETETAAAVRSQEYAAWKLAELIDNALMAVLFSVLSLALACLPAAYFLGKGVASLLRRCLAPCCCWGRVAASPGLDGRQSALHSLALILISSGLVLPAVASTMRVLAQKELHHQRPEVLLSGFDTVHFTVGVKRIMCRCLIIFIVTGIVEFFWNFWTILSAKRFCNAASRGLTVAWHAAWVTLMASVVIISCYGLFGSSFSCTAAHAGDASAILAIAGGAVLALEGSKVLLRPVQASSSSLNGEEEPALPAESAVCSSCVLAPLEALVAPIERVLAFGSGYLLWSALIVSIGVLELAGPYAMPKMKAAVIPWVHPLTVAAAGLVIIDAAVYLFYRTSQLCASKVADRAFRSRLLPQ